VSRPVPRGEQGREAMHGEFGLPDAASSCFSPGGSHQVAGVWFRSMGGRKRRGAGGGTEGRGNPSRQTGCRRRFHSGRARPDRALGWSVTWARRRSRYPNSETARVQRKDQKQAQNQPDRGACSGLAAGCSGWCCLQLDRASPQWNFEPGRLIVALRGPARQ
jgi:hypothetical protein